jgi:acyl-coenzyme A synthetase/AMP-(fatty) acid ligase
MADLPPCDWAIGDPDRLGYIVFTSGTSGQPQAVAHAHRVLWARGMMHQGWEGLTDTDRLLHAGALNWTYTLGTGLLDPWTVGATALIPATGVTPADLPHLMDRCDATILAAVPGVFRQMLRQPMPALQHLRHGLSAGEKMSAATQAAWTAATGTALHEALGMTECSTYLSSAPGRPVPDGAVGFAQKGRCIAILDDLGQPVPRGTDGILAIHRSDPGLMIGYLGDPAGTEARYVNEWFVTGDRARMADNGAVHYLGRNDDLMNTGGLRLSPQEVEAAFAGVAGLTEVAVTEVPVKDGVTVIGCLFAGTETLTAQVLADRAAKVLAPWKRPRIYHQVDTLPRTRNAKLDRRAMAGLFPKEGT